MSDNLDDKYVEVAIRISQSEWKNLDIKDFNEKMWVPAAKVELCVKCEVLAFGINGFISKLLDKEDNA